VIKIVYFHFRRSPLKKKPLGDHCAVEMCKCAEFPSPLSRNIGHDVRYNTRDWFLVLQLPVPDGRSTRKQTRHWLIDDDDDDDDDVKLSLCFN
jgi:hypothetical protein